MKSVGIKILVVILVIVIAIAAALLAIKVVKDRNSIQTNTGEEYVNKEPTVVEIKEPETFKGTERPIAVMIDNNTKALPHAGLNDAYLVYEMIVEGEKIDIPPKELELICFLCSQPNKVFTRDQLLNEVWGYDYYGDSRTVDVHVKRLREKINGKSDKWDLKTVWGVGYKFEVK